MMRHSTGTDGFGARKYASSIALKEVAFVTYRDRFA
jgi:hypothetical protein